MEQLSDDVLVRVMQYYLDIPDLLTCRLVCKRLGSLAVLPAIWRSRGVHYRGVVNRGLLCAVLRVAPCVRYLCPNLSSKQCQLTYTSTRCAVKILVLEVRQPEEVVLAALLIRHQQAIGGLKQLRVSLVNQELPDEASMLLVTVASTTGLGWLSVHGIPACGPSLASFVSRFTLSAPSLKRFETNLTAESYTFCEFILLQHTTTLEDIELHKGTQDQNILFPSIVPLLAAMPNLCKLTCRMYPGLEALADCKTLRELTIVVRPEDRHGVEGTAVLLCRAKHLRAVALKYEPTAAIPADCGVGLVLALTTSGESRLESLTIDNGWGGPLPQPVLSALPFLPALQHLKVEPAPDQLLLGINPSIAPALQTLLVTCHLTDGGLIPCGHSYLHNDVYKTLLSVNPSIKLFVPHASGSCKGAYYCEGNFKKLCQPCTLGCHQGFRSYIGEYKGHFEKMLIPRNISE